METKNKSEYTEIFEVVVSIDQIVLNNDIFKSVERLIKLTQSKMNICSIIIKKNNVSLFGF